VGADLRRRVAGAGAGGGRGVIAWALRRVLRPVEPRGRREIECDVGDELAFHMEMLERDLCREGLGAVEARAESERRFGDIATIRRRCVAAATWEKAMLQRINLAILLVIGGLLAWAVLVQQRQIASAAQLVAAMREQSEAARAQAEASRVRAEAARHGAVAVESAAASRSELRNTADEQHLIFMGGWWGAPGCTTCNRGFRSGVPSLPPAVSRRGFTVRWLSILTPTESVLSALR